MTTHTPPRRYIHVAPGGSDGASGDPDDPLPTVSAAAERAAPGDTVRIHDGVYRERIDPPNGGTSDDSIVFEAAPAADPVLKGSIILEDWDLIGEGCWETTLSNDRFGPNNPFNDLLGGHWFDDCGRDHHRGMVYVDDRPLPEAEDLSAVTTAPEACWAASVERNLTTIRLALDTDLDSKTVEATTEPTVFYPSNAGIDCITLRGLTFKHAATQWAPPTLEQIGLVGTNWSRGWRIENCTVTGSRCTGVTLGLFGDWQTESPWQGSSEGYNQTIRDAIENGWERGQVGGHTVKNCEISHCGQAGIVGSLGAAFSTIQGNQVHHINTHRQFAGEELAGIKFHGAVDTTIAENHSHHARRGLWLDWMTQGTRVRANCFHDNDIEDCYVEVNHGPFLLESNCLLSDRSLRDRSQGGAYVHNLVTGEIVCNTERERSTPHLEPHSTAIAGVEPIPGGDDRFFNNLFVGGTGLGVYQDPEHPIEAADNVYLAGADPAPQEFEPCVLREYDPKLTLAEDSETCSLTLDIDPTWSERVTSLVTTERLGMTVLSGQGFTDTDGSSISIDRDYHGEQRDLDMPAVGPFEALRGTDGRMRVDLWPRED